MCLSDLEAICVLVYDSFASIEHIVGTSPIEKNHYKLPKNKKINNNVQIPTNTHLSNNRNLDYTTFLVQHVVSRVTFLNRMIARLTFLVISYLEHKILSLASLEILRSIRVTCMDYGYLRIALKVLDCCTELQPL